ncbi:MAG TPA: fimbria/pilus outer membrane usher protein [Candidatus Baltobacteraceae bacterium]
MAITLALVGATAIPTQAQQGIRAILTVKVNSVDDGLYTVFVDSSDVEIAQADLKDLGLSKAVAAHAVASGIYVSLNALKPDVTWRIDTKTLTLSITVDPKLLAASSFDIRSGQQVPVTRTKSAFINYGALLTQGQSGRLSTQFGSTLGAGVASATFNDVAGIYRATNLNWTIDNEHTLRRSVIGDSFVNFGDLTGGGIVRGVTIERNFGLDPFVNRFVTHALTGYVATPSTADVYVNGSLVQQLQLPPGSFNIQNLPLVAGANNAQVVIRDAFGNVQTLSQSFYQGLQLLNKGQTDYTYTAGDPQDGLGHSLGAAGLAGSYSLGVNDHVTVGGRIQSAARLVNAGPTVAISTRAGEFDLLGFASSANGQSGSAAEFLYNYSTPRVYFNIGVQLESASYANLFQPAAQDHALSSETVSLGLPIGRRVLAFNLTHAHDRDLGEETGYGALTTIPLAKALSLSIDYQRTQAAAGFNRTDVYTALNFPIGQQSYGSITNDASAAGGSVNVQASRPAFPDQPLGYNLSITRGNNPQLQAVAQYDGPVGIYTLNRTDFAGNASTYFNAAGAIVFADHHILLSRPLQGGYVVVSAAGPTGLPVDVNGRYVGKTNRGGLLVVPEVQEYYPNHIALDTGRAPIGEQYSTTERNVEAAHFAAALATFDAHRTQSFLGTVNLASTNKAPQYGMLTVDLGSGQQATSNIGEAGEFYLENLAPGPHPATVKYAGGACGFTLVIPETSLTYVKLGVQTCTKLTP